MSWVFVNFFGRDSSIANRIVATVLSSYVFYLVFAYMSRMDMHIGWGVCKKNELPLVRFLIFIFALAILFDLHVRIFQGSNIPLR